MERATRSMAIAVGVLAVLLWAMSGWATAEGRPQFKMGFKALAEQISEVVGDPLEDERYNPTNGDALQRTTTGLMVWRKADNWTAFTDGARTWVMGPAGVQVRLNQERFEWEHDPPATPAPPTPTPTPIPFSDWQPGPGAVAGQPIMGVIDSPKEGAKLAGDLTVTGWAVDPRDPDHPWNGIDDFRVYLDGPEGRGRRVDTGKAQSQRFDVSTALGKAGYYRSGFALTVDRGSIPLGGHSLYVYVHSRLSGWWFKVVNVVLDVPMIGTAYVDGRQLLTNLRWASYGFDDPLLRGALAYAYNYSPEWRILADLAAITETKVRWGSLPASVGGLYDRERKTISINSRLRYERTPVLAAVLAHETYHAALGGSDDAFSCFQDEVNAFRWSAYVWLQLRPSAVISGWERSMDALAWAWVTSKDALVDWVLTSPGYQQQCLGGVVR